MLDGIDFGDMAIGCSIILLIVISSLALQHWIKSALGRERLEACHEVGGYYMAAVGTLYAVILGMAVSEASSKYDDARHFLESEANSLLEVYYLSGTFPMNDQLRLQQDIRQYVEEVIDQEWSSMEHNSFSEKALAMMAGLIKDTIGLNPVSERQKTTYAVLVNAVTDASESRRGRINITQYGMQPIEWMSLLIGGVITIVFTFFFNVENRVAHMLMTTMVSLILSMNLYLVYLLNHPFSGGLAMPPEQFQVLKKALSFTDPMMPGAKTHP